jgi:hypothetical protein
MTKRKIETDQTGAAEKNFILSSTDLVEAFQEIADRFMLEIFELEPGEYIITDESDIQDFTSFGTSDTGPIWHQIADAYGLSHEDVGSGRLVKIFQAIADRRRVQ